MAERVRTVLLDALSAGQSDIDNVSRLARRYLSTAETSVAQIALLLGYQDSSSFHGAYRGWAGTTPAPQPAGLRNRWIPHAR